MPAETAIAISQTMSKSPNEPQGDSNEFRYSVPTIQTESLSAQPCMERARPGFLGAGLSLHLSCFANSFLFNPLMHSMFPLTDTVLMR